MIQINKSYNCRFIYIFDYVSLFWRTDMCLNNLDLLHGGYREIFGCLWVTKINHVLVPYINCFLKISASLGFVIKRCSIVIFILPHKENMNKLANENIEINDYSN